MAEETKKEEALGNNDAPAVVGQISVSNDLLDFSSLGKVKKCDKKGSCEIVNEDSLTPRERAILERKKKEAK